MSTADYEKNGEIGVITLSNPPQNRLSTKLLEKLGEAVQSAESDNVRALMFQGREDNFSFGADVSEWPSLSGADLRNLITTANQVFERIEGLPIPTIAAVRGGCMGGGFELALHCDLIVAADDTQFRFPEATLAIPPLAGGVQRLAERIGRAATARVVLLTDVVTGTEALQLGIVARTASSADVPSVAIDIARQLAQGPTLAYAATKSLLQGWSQGGVGVADRLLQDVSASVLRSQDFARAVANAAEALKRNTPRPVLAYEGK